MRRVVALCLTLTACTNGYAATRGTAAPASFDVHEWGVIVVEDGQTHVATWPAPWRSSPAAPAKPVLYVHLAPGTPSLTFDLAVSLGKAGQVREHWPPAVLADDLHEVSWRGVRATAGACKAPVWPDPQTMCANLYDGICEQAELAHYATADAACLTSKGKQSPLLFYRGISPGAELPLTVSAKSPEEPVKVTNRGGDVVTGMVWRVSRKNGAHASTLLREVAPPKLGATITLNPATDAVDEASAHRRLREAAMARGLTAEEAARFDQAWATEIFGAATTAGGPRSPKGSGELLLYWLSEAEVDALLPLTITPKPAAVHRAIMVMVVL